eukprot:TRINITY_DN20680_c0_g1_i1.p1 TRINITY_DN20680_c0_g1~~TRINITY_DN20680_c0_g1_i1.p1  ORF type:complete len:231 (+),score=12.68 TRINITY_DN20680_c0_g1_i1:73-765(+)
MAQGSASTWRNERGPYSRSQDGSFCTNPVGAAFAKQRSWQDYCWCILIVLVVGTLVVGVAVLILWLIFRPRQPDFSLQDLQVHGVQVDQVLPGYNNFEVHLSLNFTFVLAAKNPNLGKIQFDPIAIDVLYKDQFLGVALIPAFELPAKRNATILSQFLVQSINVVRAAALDLLGDFLDDHILLRITGEVIGRVHILGVATPRLKMQVRCEALLKPEHKALGSKVCGEPWT